MSVFSIGEKSELTEPPNTYSPDLIVDEIKFDFPVPPAVDATNTPIAIESTANDEFDAIKEEQGGEDVPITTRKESCSCVAWNRANSKVGQPPKVNYARELKITRLEPSVGAWIVFGKGYFGSAGHTGIVDYVNPEYNYMVTFTGFNFPRCEKKTMTINISDSKYNVLGFFRDIP